MLAVVEHQQQLFRSQVADQRVHQINTWSWGHPQHRRDPVDHDARVAHPGELHQPRTATKLGRDLGCHLTRQTRLAHATHAGQRHHPRLTHQRSELDDFSFAAHERAVLHRQIARKRIQRLQSGKLACQPRRHHLEHLDRLREIAQTMLTQADQFHRITELVTHELLHRTSRQHLTPVRHRHQTGGTIHHRAVIVTIPFLARAAVDTHTNEESHPALGWLIGDRSLRLDRGTQRLVGPGEHPEKPIPGRLHHTAVMRPDRNPQDRVVTSQRRPHRLRVLFPQSRRALEIGEQERHRPRWQLDHDTPRATPTAQVQHAPISPALLLVTGGTLRQPTDTRSRLVRRQHPTAASGPRGHTYVPIWRVDRALHCGISYARSGASLMTCTEGAPDCREGWADSTKQIPSPSACRRAPRRSAAG